MRENLTRQAEVLPINKIDECTIEIIGAGAVGGWAALMLTKMGFSKIRVWDFDNVSIENMNSQFYRFSDINTPKVDALKKLVKDFANIDITVNNLKFTGDEIKSRIVICAVDSMEARKQIFGVFKKSEATEFFIDSRMAVEYLTMYCVSKLKRDEREGYAKSLFSDTEAVQERCTNKATSYTASLAGALVAKMVKDIVTGNKYSRTIQYNVKDNKQLVWQTEEKQHTTA